MAVGTSVLRCQFTFLFLIAFGLSPLHCLDDDSDYRPSLTEQQCGSLDNEDVDFGDYELAEGGSNCGLEVQLDRVNRLQPPSVSYKDAKPGVDYLIAMVDPDAPYEDDPVFKSWLHWIVGNIDGVDLAKGDISSDSDTFVEYNPPSPPKPQPGSRNDHRYFIYVFEQGYKLEDDAKIDSRKNFDIDKYKDKFNLKAVAMNMFKTHS